MTFTDREAVVIKRPKKTQGIEMHLYTKPDGNLVKEDSRNRAVLRINDIKNNVKVLANIRVADIDFLAKQSDIALADWTTGKKECQIDLLASSAEESNTVKFFSGAKFTDERGFHKCYQLDIKYRPDRDYPIWITCKNFWAPLQKTTTGGTTIKMSEADQSQQAQICLTMKEWITVISKLVRVRNQWDTFRVVTGELDPYFSPDTYN